jgi:hypothetical protein
MSTPLDFSTEAHAANAYIDPTDPEGRKLIGSTTVIKKALPPYLVPWAAKLTAEEAVDTVDNWRTLERAAAVDMLKRAPDRTRDAAGDKGTIVHRVMELAARGERPDEVYDTQVQGYVTAGLAFLDEWQPEFVWQEATVFHPEAGYAGTLDFIARLPGLGLVIGDYKTSKGIYPEVAVQLASYRYASHAVDAQHRRVDIPHVDGAVVVHIRGDGTYEVRPVKADETAFQTFQHCLAVCDWKARRGVIGAKVAPPAPQPADPFAGLPDATGAPQKPRPVERRDWLRARIANILGAEVPAQTLAEMNVDSAAALMVQWWPEDVATLKASDAHTDDELTAIAERCAMVEKALGLTFPDPDPSVPLVPERLAADHPDVVAMVARLRALPADLLADVEAGAAQVPNMVALTSGRITPALIAALDELVAKAEAGHASRKMAAAALCSSLSALGVPEAPVVGAATLGHHEDPARLTEAQLDRFWALVDALEIGLVVVGPSGQLIAGTGDGLVAIHGNRRDALNAAKRHAKAHDLDVPKSFADVLGDPLLVALAGRQAPAATAA